MKAYVLKLKEAMQSREVFRKGFEAQMTAVEVAIRRTLVCEGEKQTYRDILRGLVQAIDGGSSSSVNLELERARALLATEA